MTKEETIETISQILNDRGTDEETIEMIRSMLFKNWKEYYDVIGKNFIIQD